LKPFRLYIALILLGIFLFPVLFQSVHSTGHKKKCCSGYENFCESVLPHKDLHTNSLAEQSKEKKCPVCKYQFPVNKLPELSLYSTIAPVITGTICEIILSADINDAFSIKSPRAPPAIS